MRAVLICPDERREVPLISAQVPLALAPALGQTVLEYWMSHLACAKTKEITVLAHSHHELIRHVVGDGARWGVEANVITELEELTVEHATEKYSVTASVVDHLPGLPEHPLFAGYDSWYRTLLALMPRAKTPDRVGVRELSDGIWVGLHGHISAGARLEAPCWLGDHVYVGAGAVIGPGTILENGSFVEPEAVISGSIVGPTTFVGRYVRITNSIAWGDTLVDLRTGEETIEPNAFLLCSLHLRHSSVKPTPWMDRLAEWFGHWDSEESLKGEALLSNEVTDRIARQIIE